MTSISTAAVKERQRKLNAFTSKRLKGVGPIPVDGKEGPLTRKRIIHCKWWLGWESRDGSWSPKFQQALGHPFDRKNTSGATVYRGIKRRAAHNALWVKTHFSSGVTTYDGVRVASVAVPILKWCRAHGWHGRLVSGYRDPAYSEHLCYAMCGRPSCPGRCAGRGSNHAGKTARQFAVDVSDYSTFSHVVARCPIRPHIYNALGSQDPVHFSPTGR